ncbi:MAG TPA: universal stress protein [Herpetosiphonaceae bacterium]
MNRAIIVPLDGSAFGEQALPLASAIAGRSGAALHLAHVHVPMSAPVYMPGMPVIDPELHSLSREHERSYLEGIAQRLPDTLRERTRVVLLDPPVAVALGEYAAGLPADLIVMTTHGRGGLARVWLGSVADRLVRHSTTPVLLLRPREAEAEQQIATFRRILIPLDGSPLAEQMLPPALALGQLMDARYILLQVVEPFDVHGFTPGLDIAMLEREVIRERHAQARAYLADVIERFTLSEYQPQTQILDAHQPAHAILEAVRLYACDLIALATHGHGGFARLLLGSVVDKVVRGSDVPVLLFHPQPASG